MTRQRQRHLLPFSLACLISTVFIPLPPGQAFSQSKSANLPQPRKSAITNVDLLGTIAADPDLTTFYRAITLAGMGDYVRTTNAATIFAPTNAAFSKWPADDLEQLMAYPPALQTLVEFHISEAAITYREAQELSYMVMLTKSLVSVSFADNQLWIDDALVVRPDLSSSNAIIHVIDTVLKLACCAV